MLPRVSIARSVVAVPTQILHKQTKPLADRIWAALGLSFLPIILTSVLIAGYVGIFGSDVEITRAVTDTSYGLASLAALGTGYVILTDQERRAAITFDVPTRKELAWTFVCLPLGIGGFLFGSTVAAFIGFELSGFDYTLADPITVSAVIFGGVILAPLVEEILFRGVLLGSLLGREISPVMAGLVTIVLFAGMHLISLGVAGVFAVAGWAVFPTLLRLKFNNLTGAWLLHTLNNIYSYIVVVALGLV